MSSTIVFSGTSYLGLERHPQMMAWINEGVKRYGTHYGGSRRSDLAPEIYAETEGKLAQWIGVAATLFVSSGTTAGQLATGYLAQKGMAHHYSPNVHPSLWKNMEVKRSKNWKTWYGRLGVEKLVGVTNAINPLDVSIPDWDALPKDSSSYLLVDDAHYLGIGGKNGRGSWRELRQKWAGELMLTASLGKAFAIPAGLIMGSKKMIEDIQSLPQFGGASPPPPAYIFALNQAWKLIAQQQLKLQKNIHIVQQALKAERGFSFLPHYPVIGVTDHTLADRLAKEGILISSFNYPGSDAPRYTRIVLRADHTHKQLQKLINLIIQL